MRIELRRITEHELIEVESKLDLTDAGEELLIEIRNKSDDLHSILMNEKLVGLTLVEKGKTGYLYIFVDPTHRHKGIASKVLTDCERLLREGGSSEILTSYKSNNEISKYFVSKFSYKTKFRSKYMTYTGDTFKLPELSIRNYLAEDYSRAFRLSSKAFHVMRLSTGYFPESKIAEPTEESRTFWTKTVNERFIYTDGDEIIGHARVVDNEIDSISIRSDYQGKGFGRNFMKYICNQVLNSGHDSVALYCVDGNVAINLYESLGFKEVYTAEFSVKQLVAHGQEDLII